MTIRRRKAEASHTLPLSRKRSPTPGVTLIPGAYRPARKRCRAPSPRRRRPSLSPAPVARPARGWWRRFPVAHPAAWHRHLGLAERRTLRMPRQPGFGATPELERGNFELEAPLFARAARRRRLPRRPLLRRGDRATRSGGAPRGGLVADHPEPGARAVARGRADADALIARATRSPQSSRPLGASPSSQTGTAKPLSGASPDASSGTGASVSPVEPRRAHRTTCDSPPRLPTRSRIRREAGTGRLNGAGYTGIRV